MNRFLPILPLFLSVLIITSCQGKTMNKSPEHAVIVHFNYGSTDLQRLFALEDKLEEAITKAGVGEYDGNEVATDGSDGYLYMYGPDADRLFEVIRPILESSTFMRGATVTKRYGPPSNGVKKIDIIISL